ncbi:hypothetical protein OQA88_8426 [Cercophora sp. LCS_1]
MAREKKTRNIPIVTLIRTQVPPTQPLPPSFEDAGKKDGSEENDNNRAKNGNKRDDDEENEDGEDEEAQNPGPPSCIETYLNKFGWQDWNPLLRLLGKTRGCLDVLCGRVVENPEMVLLLITWWDQSCTDEFMSSPGYNAFIHALTSSSHTDSMPSIQNVEFLARGASYPMNLRGWKSFSTITMPFPATDARRSLFERLRGPEYYVDHNALDPALKIAWHQLPVSLTLPNAHRGWTLSTRVVLVTDEDGRGELKEVQDGVLHQTWLRKDLEEKWGTNIPGILPGWKEKLEGLGTLEVKEEHVGLMWVAGFQGAGNR